MYVCECTRVHAGMQMTKWKDWQIVECGDLTVYSRKFSFKAHIKV